MQDAAPPRDAVGINLIADTRLRPHCLYAVRRSPRTCSLLGGARLSHHSKSVIGEREIAERSLNSRGAFGEIRPHAFRLISQVGRVLVPPSVPLEG